MTQYIDWAEREREFVERATRLVRLLTWTGMLAATVLVVWILTAFVTAPAGAGDGCATPALVAVQPKPTMESGWTWSVPPPEPGEGSA